MKINCNCGNVIVDNSDDLKIKGHVIPDSKWFYFWDSIDSAIEKSGSSEKEKEEACMALRKLNLFKTIWECSSCGKLFVNGEGSELIEYSVDSGIYNGVLLRR